MSIMAGMAVVNTVAVANVQTALGAVPPDRELHEPGKGLREASVERPGIDPGRDRPNDVGTAIWPVAGSTVRSTAIMLAPTLGHSGLLLASSRLASVIITTLSDTRH